jgi:N-acetylmuramoyl-L-alanine amidase
VKFHWILPSWLLPSMVGTFGILLFSSPAEAGRLQFWQFNTSENRLTFTTDERVQPNVQLVFNPHRLIIDLPGTRLGRPRINQAVGGAIREIRVAQFNAQTTRIVIELASGYTLNPDEVEVLSTNAEEWTVQLPDLERGADTGSTPLRVPVSPIGSNESSQSTQAIDADTTLEEVRITQDGFFFRTRGDKPDIDQDYSADRRQLVLELEDTAISPRLTQRQIRVDRYQVSQIQLVQVADEDPPKVRITLDVTEDSPNWRATATNLGGVVLVPTGGIAAGAPNERASQSLTRQNQEPSEPASGRSERPERTVPSRPVNGSVDLPNLGDRRVRIAIDPGHGGRDPGAVGINGLQEKGIVLDIGQRVAELLEQQGAQVILTRQDDREIDLEPRVANANRGNATLFVSIHANAISLDRPDINGVETYYYSSDASYRLAQVIQTSVAQATGMRNIGVKQARFYVLRNTTMPAVLVEVGFVTGRDDAPRLADPAFRDLMAQAIARGILQYVQQNL